MNEWTFWAFFSGLWTWTMNACFLNLNPMNAFIFFSNNERNERFFRQFYLKWTFFSYNFISYLLVSWLFSQGALNDDVLSRYPLLRHFFCGLKYCDINKYITVVAKATIFLSYVDPFSRCFFKTVHMNVHSKNHERFERFERLNVNVNVIVQGTPLPQTPLWPIYTK